MNRLLARLLGRYLRDDNPDDAGGGAGAEDGVRYAHHDRAAWLEQIAATTEDDQKFGTGTHDDDAEAESGGENNGGAVQETDEQRVEREEREAEEAAAAAAAAASGAQAAGSGDGATVNDEMVELIVDGKTVKKPLSEVLDAGKRYLQKDMTADERIAEATRILNEAKKLNNGGAQPVTTRPSESVQEEDDAALARAIQLGNDEEARSAIRKLRESGRASDQSITSMIDARLEFREAATWVQQEYNDILKDPLLGGVFMQKEQEARKAGDQRSYRDLYKEIGDGLRKWRDGLAPKQNPTQDKETRKAEAATVVPTARAVAPVTTVDDEDEIDANETQAYIAEARRRRGQG